MEVLSEMPQAVSRRPRPTVGRMAFFRCIFLYWLGVAKVTAWAGERKIKFEGLLSSRLALSFGIGYNGT
jgi:hypothetical protein